MPWRPGPPMSCWRRAGTGAGGGSRSSSPTTDPASPPRCGTSSSSPTSRRRPRGWGSASPSSTRSSPTTAGSFAWKTTAPRAAASSSTCRCSGRGTGTAWPPAPGPRSRPRRRRRRGRRRRRDTDERSGSYSLSLGGRGNGVVMAGERILIVDDEKSIRTTLAAILNDEGYRPIAAGSGPEALARIGEEVPDVVILDIWLPDMDGIDTLAELKRQWPELPVIMVSGHGTIETAVKATKLGAYDYIEKPLSLEKTLLVIDRALEHARLERENRLLRERIERAHEILGTSPAITELRRQISTAAPTNGRVLIFGENGSGKELVARAVHALSARRDRPFVEVNCAAIPDELIESELFGHEKGAFTGAIARRRGKFELADAGTLFLDEIGDMSLRTQAKVLRALEEQTVERIGGHEPIRVDVRVIAASNKPLQELIAQGRFRGD